MPKQINGVTLKDAETNTERYLLGIIAKKATDIKYGRVSLEIVVRDSKLQHCELKTDVETHNLQKIDGE